MAQFGLSNLAPFGERHADVFQRLVSARDYPLAGKAGNVNITASAALLELLIMRDEGIAERAGARPSRSMWRGPDMPHFFCHVA